MNIVMRELQWQLDCLYLLLHLFLLVFHLRQILFRVHICTLLLTLIQLEKMAHIMIWFNHFKAHTLLLSFLGENLVAFFPELLSFQWIFKIIHNPIITHNPKDSYPWIKCQSKSSAPNKIGFYIDFSGLIPVLISSNWDFNFSFSSTILDIFWFIIALLLDFKIERSLTLFLYPVICSSNSFLI